MPQTSWGDMEKVCSLVNQRIYNLDSVLKFSWKISID